MDRYDLYEACVQRPAELAAFLSRAHANEPLSLREDFCGSAALCRAWVTARPDAARRAVGIDLEPAVIHVAKRRLGLINPAQRARISLVAGNALHPPHRPEDVAPDIVFVGNFSLGEIDSRTDLISYLAASRARLAPGGVFAADTFGGASSLRVGAVQRIGTLADELQRQRRVRYTWEQRRVHALRAHVECALHFRVEAAPGDGEPGEIVAEFPDAFVYRWRLWSVPELCDALREAGFTEIDVWRDLHDRPLMKLRGRSGDAPVEDESAADLESIAESHIVCLVARK
ncbi:MAG: hypothetical protein AB7O77_11235 [Phycisphaerales bacterium]